MNLLIIDEISMVRADLLDAIDSVLRRYRDQYKTFWRRTTADDRRPATTCPRSERNGMEYAEPLL